MKQIVPESPAIVRNQQAAVQALFQQYVVPSYGRYDLVLSHGQGSWLYDVNGKRFLDLGGGIAVCSLGHGNAEITDALQVCHWWYHDYLPTDPSGARTLSVRIDTHGERYAEGLTYDELGFAASTHHLRASLGGELKHQLAVDEMIRWTSPVKHFMRTATVDYEIRGTTVKAGQDVLLGYVSRESALKDYGVRHINMPATPHNVWQAIQTAKKAGNITR